MKKLIAILIISIILSGCILPESIIPFSHLQDFDLPNDAKFIRTIKLLDTPKKICLYMEENFLAGENPEKDYTPYEMYQIKQGNCANFACFAAFVANYHGYDTYLIYMLISTPWIEKDQAHLITVYKINKYYAYSDFAYYFDGLKNIDDIMDNYSWFRYNIYDCDMNIIETVYF